MRHPGFRLRLATLCLCLGTFALAGCSSREERAQAYYEKAQSYIEKNDYVKARLELRNALQRKPDLLPAWQALAQVEEHEKNMQGLASALRRITEIAPDDLPATTQLARLYLLGNAIDPALKLANKAGEIDPKNAEVKVLKAAALLKLKDNDGARRSAEEAIALDPDNTGAYVILAGIQFQQGDSNGALQTLAPIEKAHGDDLGLMLLKVNIFNQQNNQPQTEALLHKLIALYPAIPSFRSQLIQFYLQHKRQDDAINELRTITTAKPDDTNAGLELVTLLGAVKGNDAARDELLARIKAGPGAFAYQIALAKLDFALGKAEASQKLLQQLIAEAKSREDAFTAKNTLATLYMSQNNAAAAEPLINDILKEDARNTIALRLRAAVHLERNQIDDAITDLRSALNDQPRSPELLQTLGAAYERNGSIDLAGKALFDAMKASNYSPTVGLAYVAFLQRRSVTSQVESVLTELANRNPNSVPVLSALASVKLSRQDWVGAHAIADAIKKLGDRSDVANQIDAAAFSGQGKFSNSVAILQDSYSAHPGAVRPMVSLVNAYVQSGQTNEAETFIRSVLADNPSNAEALVLMGSVQLAKNAPDKAEQFFRSAIEKKPTDPTGYLALGELYGRQRKTDDAQRIVEQGLKQQPGNFGLQLALATLLETKRDYDGAITQYEAMLKEQPGSLIVANNLASLLADHRTDKANLERAGALAAVLKNSDVPQFKDTLGWVTYQRQDYRSALRLLEDAAKSLPNLALVQYHLGMSYLATGQDDKANDAFANARKLAPKDAELAAKIDAALKSRPEKAKG